MAQKLVPGDSWFEDFEHGQGFDPLYFDYSVDLDTNFEAIRIRINALVDEVTSIQGPNSLAVMDILDINDPDAAFQTDTGVIGIHSYLPVRITGNTQLQVNKGQIIVDGLRYEQGSLTVHSGDGGWSGTYYLSIDANGVPRLEKTAAQGIKDIYTVPWNSTTFTAAPTFLNNAAGGDVEVFMDGDAWLQMQTVASGMGTFPGGTYSSPDKRIGALERILSGFDEDIDGNALGPIRISYGSAGTAFLGFGLDGAIDDAGWYRGGANIWTFTNGTNQRFDLHANGIRMTSVNLGAANAVNYGFNNDNGAGFYWEDDTVTGVAVAENDVRSMQWKNGQALFEDGATGAPGGAFRGDLNTGFWTDAADNFVISTGGTEALRLDANGAMTLDLQPRVRVEVDGFSLTSAAVMVNIPWDSSDYDVSHDTNGWWHAATSLYNLVVPSDGVYLITACVQFNESTAGAQANSGDYRAAHVEVGGVSTDRAASIVPPTGTVSGADTHLSISEVTELSDGDVVTLQAAYRTLAASSMDIDAEMSITRLA